MKHLKTHQQLNESTHIEWDYDEEEGETSISNEFENSLDFEISGSEKLYSIDDIKKFVVYMNQNYSKVEDELAKPYEDNGKDLPNDFFKYAYNICFKRAIESI